MPSSFGLRYSFVIRHSDFVIFPHMTPARFQTIEEIFLAALEQEPDQVSAFLDTTCEGDVVLRREVEALLASDQRAGRFIETSSVGLATKVIQNQQADSLVGRTIGHYKISESIGTGGMGEVYLATDITAGRKAALKLLPLRFTGDAERLKRFQREARAVVGLNHPNIVTVYEIGEDHSSNYIASELIEGETLRQCLMRGPMQQSEVIDVAIQVASALVAAHQAGIVHRDIKPENIMLRPDGYVKVLDFGIAKLAEQEVPLTTPREEALLLVETNLGSILGTVRYMSPEQARGGQVDKSTDIWSLGVVLYEMVTGHAPFTGDTPKEVMSAILEKEPALLTSYNPHAPAELQQIIGKTLRKDREQRYQSAHELLEAFQSLRRSMEFKTALERHEKDAAASIAQKRIAVLPFKPVLPESRDQVLELGMADTLITKLSNSREIIVRSLTSVRKYGGLEQDPVSAGRELEVNSVLEGNVQRVGDRIRVTARLIKIADGSSLWAATFDEKFTDVFSVQDAISQKVADALALRLSEEENKRLTKRYTDNVKTYQLYLTGRYHWNKLTPAEINKSIVFFKQAIDLDPTYALAYCGLADAYAAFAPQSDMPPKDVLPQAKAAATKALEIDESLAEPHALRSFIHTWFDWDWAEAEKEAKRAIALNPNLGPAHIAYAQLLSVTGRHQEAITEGTRAQELDPLSLIINTLHGSFLYYARRDDEASARLQKTIELEPNFWLARVVLGKVYINKGKYPEAIAELNKATELSGGNSEPLTMTGCAWAMAGDSAKARAVLKELKSLSSQRYVPAPNVALLCSMLEERNEAFAWLEKAYQDRDMRVCRLKVDPRWDAMRFEPRFVAILKRIGLQ